MPALLVHMTLAHDTLDREDAPAPVVAACRQHHDAYMLGAILPDLPYHARFPTQLALHLARRGYLHSAWGDVMHARGTGRLALALLAHIMRSHPGPDARDRLLALCAGYLSHHAADRVTHPVIQRLVAERSEPGELPAVAHSRIERYQNMVFHRDRLGHPLPASPAARRIATSAAGCRLWRPDLDQTLWEALRTACLETHARAPRRREVRSWLWGIAAYGTLLSSRLGKMEALDDPERIRREWYAAPDCDLHAPLMVSMELTTAYWQTAHALLQEPVITTELRAAFLAEVRDVDLATGA